MSGYGNLTVELDGVAVASAGSIPMSTDHSLLVTADSVLVVDSAGVALIQTLRSLLTASNPLVVYRDLAAQMQDLANQVGIEEASTRIEAAEALAFDPAQDAVALWQAIVEIGDSLASDNQAALSKRVESARSSASPPAVTFLYVNGISTDPKDLLFTVARLDPVLYEAGFGDRTLYPLENFYNRTAKYQDVGTGAALECLSLKANLVDKSLFSKLIDVATCLQATINPPPGFLGDLAESAAQVTADKLGNWPAAAQPDAVLLAHSIEYRLSDGGRVVLIVHSQGNLMAQQALAVLATSSQASRAKCVGVVGLAPPTSEGWPVSGGSSVQQLSVKGQVSKDVLLLVLPFLPHNHDYVSSDLSDRFDSWLTLLAPLRSIPSTKEAYAGAEFAMDWRLHSIDNDYLGSFRPRAAIEQRIIQQASAVTARCPSSVATNLAFTSQPVSSNAGQYIPTVQVTARDGSGNTATGFTGDVSIQITPGTGTPGAQLSGTKTATTIAGVATFPSLSIDKVGSGYTLTATTTGLAEATSDPFTIIPGVPTHLVFTVQPTTAQAGSPITPGVVVTALDVGNNTATSYSGNVTMAIGTNPSGGLLSGTNPVAAASGVATFSNLSIDKTGIGYTLMASAPALTPATSTLFDVGHSTVSQTLSVIAATSPITASNGSSVSTITVTARDGSNNPVPGVTVVLSATGTGNTLTQPTTPTNQQGVTTGTLYSTKAESKVVSATIDGVPITPTAPVVVNPASAAQLSFTGEPSNTVANATITPPVTVTASDAFGNAATAYNGNVFLAIGTNPVNGTLSGTIPKTASNGVAQFSDLHIDKLGTGYTLQASAASLNGAISSPFNVVAGLADHLAFVAQPTNTEAGQPITPAVVVEIQDAENNRVAGATNVVTLDRGLYPDNGASLSGPTQVSGSDGRATFSGLSIDYTGTGYTLVASSSPLQGAESQAFNIQPGPPADLRFVQEPVSTVAGEIMNPAVRVQVLDALGNPVTTSTSVITLTLGSDPTETATLSGDTVVAVVNGVATFPDLSLDVVASPYTLRAKASFVPPNGIGSSEFDILVPQLEKVYAGGSHTCALSSTNLAYCWGSNGSGQLGDSTNTSNGHPVVVRGRHRFIQLSLGAEHSCGLTSQHYAYCWGSNSDGELGIGSGSDRNAPALVQGGPFTQLSAGEFHTCAIGSDQTTYCWGYNNFNQLGNSSVGYSDHPIAVNGGPATPFVEVAAGGDHTCARTSLGDAYCWGSGSALGTGDTASSASPVLVTGEYQFTALTAGGSHTCGITSSGSFCWGDNYLGQLGDGSNATRLSPSQVTESFAYDDLSAGASHTCGLSGNQALCWGDDAAGELGDGQTTPKNHPVSVVGPYLFQAVGAGNGYSCGITVDNKAYCWGFGYSSLPTQIAW